MFKKVCIIGCGLIGSSLARAIKEKKLAEKVVSSNRSESINKKVIELKIVDQSSVDTKKMVEDSDLVVIATPLSSYKDIILKIKGSLKNGSILTDVGSVKESIIDLIEKNTSENVSWIPSHPIAGTEDSGPESGFSELFKNRWCILTPSKKAKDNDINVVKMFWENIGSKVDIMEAKQHDYILSITSHIPHLIAYNIVNTSINLQDEKKSNIVKFSAGGLRDFTRTAASNEVMWKDIFLNNQGNITKGIDLFINNMRQIKKLINKKNERKLIEIMKDSKKIRKKIVSSKQDVNLPDFGRR